MKLLRIKDNSQQKKDAFSQVAKLTGKIADKTLEQLEREGVFVFPETIKDAKDITQDQMILCDTLQINQKEFSEPFPPSPSCSGWPSAAVPAETEGKSPVQEI